MLIKDRVEIIQGDITKITVDAIVNAANSSLMGGGGVDGAIHRAGGPEILEECKLIVARQGGCPAGEAVVTTAGKLPAKYIIHTVGPVWHGGRRKEAETLRSCYLSALKLAVENNCSTVAFPCISTGVYGYPKDKAATIAVRAVSDFLAKNDTLKKVILVSFDEENYELLMTELDT